MMQTYFQKFLKKNLIFLFTFLQLLDTQAQSKDLVKADSLFADKKFDEAKFIYEKVVSTSDKFNPNIFLKLASIEESKEEYLSELYYLNQYFFRKPSEKVFEKIYEIATDRGYKGYEKSDLNYLVLYFRKYADFIGLAFLLLGVYIFGVLLWKNYRKQYSPTRHKVILIVYLLVLGFLINFPNQYNLAIIKNEEVFIRVFPSNAAAVLGKISLGNRVNVISNDDIWIRVLWEGQICYVKESDVYLIK